MEEKITCRVCHSTNYWDLVSPQGVFKCLNCGSHFRFPGLDIKWYYDHDYWYKGDEELRLHQKSHFVWFEDYIISGNTIEFGAADGDFTYLLRKKVDSANVVMYSEVKNLLRPQYISMEIGRFIGGIEDFNTNTYSRCFRNVFLVDVIEHLNDVKRAFEIVSSILVDGGRFFISTNNGDSFEAFKPIFYHREHLCVLTEKAIRHLASITGFSVLRYFVAPRDWLYIILEKKDEKS